MENINKDKEYSDVYVLNLLIKELHHKSKRLYSLANEDYIFDYPQLELANLYSDFNSLKTTTYIMDEGHYEITSFLSFWNDFYVQLSEVILNNDKNLSWLNSAYNQFDGQFIIVNEMLSNYLKQLKD